MALHKLWRETMARAVVVGDSLRSPRGTTFVVVTCEKDRVIVERTLHLKKQKQADHFSLEIGITIGRMVLAEAKPGYLATRLTDMSKWTVSSVSKSGIVTLTGKESLSPKELEGLTLVSRRKRP